MAEVENPAITEHAEILEAAANAIPDCGHAAWTIGCERCWMEVKGIASKIARVDVAAAEVRGAVAMTWYMLHHMAFVDAELEPFKRSLDLQQVAMAKEVSATLREVSQSFVSIISDAHKLANAMAIGEQALVVSKEIAEKKRKEGGNGGAGIVITG